MHNKKYIFLQINHLLFALQMVSYNQIYAAHSARHSEILYGGSYYHGKKENFHGR